MSLERDDVNKCRTGGDALGLASICSTQVDLLSFFITFKSFSYKLILQ